MELKGKRVAVLVEDLYQDQEVWYPIYRLREGGATVVTVGTGSKLYKSKHGYEVQADKDAGEVRAEQFDGVIIPGGFAPDILRRHDDVLQFVRDCFNHGSIVASICHGAWVLVSAGILKGKKATCFFAIRDDVKNAGAIYLDEEVVVDGNLITSRIPDDLPAFMRAFITAILQDKAVYSRHK